MSNNNYLMTPWGIFGDLVDGLRRAEEMERCGSGSFMPRVRVHESETGLIISAELPGVEPADIEVNIDGKKLTISGKRAIPTYEKPADKEAPQPVCEETFERSFALPYDVDPASVKAETRLGILTLTLPKAPSAQSRRIAVTAS